MTYRVVQWASGGVGRAAMEAVLRHPELELAGCWVHSADKADRDVGEILGCDPVGVIATRDVGEILALEADCVVYAPLVADREQVARLLRSGADVVTPLGWVYPPPDREAELLEACRAGGSTLHGSGIHPGGITERFPLMISSLVSAATRVRAEEFSDIRTYGAVDVIRNIMGFGSLPDEALAGPMAAMLGKGFEQSLRMVAQGMGFAAGPEIATTQEVAVATRPLDSPIGIIEPGRVAARRFQWEALVDAVPVVTAAVNWLMGEEHLDPPWSLGPEGERFEIEVVGDPSTLLTFKGLHPESIAAGLKRNPGIVATANHLVNAIPYVCRAEPGIKTYLDLPLIAGRAAPELSSCGGHS